MSHTKIKLLGSWVIIVGLLAVMVIQNRTSTAVGTIQWEQYTANGYRATINGIVVAQVWDVPVEAVSPRPPGWHWHNKVGERKGGHASTLEQAKLEAAADVAATIRALKP